MCRCKHRCSNEKRPPLHSILIKALGDAGGEQHISTAVALTAGANAATQVRVAQDGYGSFASGSASGKSEYRPLCCRKRKFGIGATLETGFTLTLQSESYSGATGANTMTEAVTNDRPTVASRPRSRKPATVSASALAVHLDCSRTYIRKLEAEGVIQRLGGEEGNPRCASC